MLCHSLTLIKFAVGKYVDDWTNEQTFLHEQPNLSSKGKSVYLQNLEKGNEEIMNSTIFTFYVYLVYFTLRKLLHMFYISLFLRHLLSLAKHGLHMSEYVFQIWTIPLHVDLLLSSQGSYSLTQKVVMVSTWLCFSFTWPAEVLSLLLGSSCWI